MCYAHARDTVARKQNTGTSMLSILFPSSAEMLTFKYYRNIYERYMVIISIIVSNIWLLMLL